MFKPAGALYFKTENGNETVAATSSLGLSYWHMQSHDQPRQTSEAILEVTATREVPGPYEPAFIVAVISCIERAYGKSPEIPSDFFGREWYNDLPSGLNEHKNVVQRYRNSEPKIVAYEIVCLDILKWLSEHGNIVELI